MAPGDPLITSALDAVASGEDLTRERAAQVMARIMAGEVSEIQIAGLLIALRTKGETVDELAGLATTMRELATPVAVAVDRAELLDTAGTGGGRRTFNVSTTAALIAAGAGCTVAKHGNRSATGLSGSADLLEALGARIDLGPAQVSRCIEEVGFGFMFAPAHHQATRYVIPVRRDLAVRTIFNFLGPLTNPAGAERQLIGVSDARYLETMARALGKLGTRRALVVSSEDGLDELSISAPTMVWEVGSDLAHPARMETITPESVGLARSPAESVPGGDPAENAAIARAVLGGEQPPGDPARDLSVLNAGAAIYAAGRAESIADGVAIAQRAIDSGDAAAALERFVAETVRLAEAPAS
ncbi:MAG TPA: anthranilate phosphoribosyltransferase [Solirubrobacteraceae bacterium]|nr:anthranilate phosphoribosyltransferase [Solirubrobacteraceae bacterium]